MKRPVPLQVAGCRLKVAATQGATDVWRILTPPRILNTWLRLAWRHLHFPISNSQFPIPCRLGTFLFTLLALFQVSFIQAATMQTIFTNGPASNRLNVVFLSEGYTSNQLTTFLSDATNAANTLLANQPFTEYAGYLNVFAISVASVEAGSDLPWLSVNTYFNSAHDSGNLSFITIPSDATGQGKVDALLQTFMPQHHLAIVLVNDRIYTGGSGGNVVVTTPCPTPSEPWLDPFIITHETAHALAGLGDEYTTAFPGFPDIEEPNTTRETNRNLIKWKAWFTPTNVPIPTPATSAYQDAIGLFQGAHYHTTNWYRPQYDCKMRSEGSDVPFCKICREALVLAIYQQVRPVDARLPLTNTLTLTSTQAQSFSLTLPQPVTHSLSFQWFTNNVPVPNATNSSLTLLPRTLGNGSNSVRAVVRDPTDFVRTDPTNLLAQTNVWTVNVNILELLLSDTRWLSSNRFAFRLTGNAPQGFAVMGSTNYSNWLTLTTNSLKNGQFVYTNSTGSTNYRWRAFRARTPP